MDDPGGEGASWLFGSRYELLADSSGNGNRVPVGNKTPKPKQNKRTAAKDANNDIDYRKLQRIDGSNNGGRYLILTRTDGGRTMSNVSPFLIKKAIDNITPNVQISRIRDGSLLLKIIDQNQAVKLMKQSTLASRIGIKICEHPTLNQSRGTIYCPDLISLKDEEILEKKSEDTGRFILTFNLSQIPLTMDVGFYNCRVRQYVPAPLRCTNCLKFGHKADQCRGNKVCADCAQLYHDNASCSSKQFCVNCRNEHNSWSKKCPIYEDEFEIQRIRVTEKLPMREARKKRRSQVPAPVLQQQHQTDLLLEC
ncbi:uncharacterized protein LOC129729227 [Wyeomyia smithii]|uniref:uncharacterized protein LOC129729227 n=1 Tax=Wyeomyia smithii TaxID=174621 RepID=UPI002467D403|nr:uncharacterized protein LOC129729227 [Wyeomyia smithii]